MCAPAITEYGMYFTYLIAKFSIFAVISLCVLICYSVWTVKVIKHLKQTITMYRIQKRMDFRDIREQNRILYNHETHIVKDIILLIICIAEMCEPVMTMLMGVFISYYDLLHEPYYPAFNTTVSLTPCTFKQTILDINSQANILIFPEVWCICCSVYALLVYMHVHQSTCMYTKRTKVFVHRQISM